MITIKDLTIHSFISDGFKRVCDICTETSTVDAWNYINVDENIMYDPHCGWVYLITVNESVYKIGETGQVLGQRSKRIKVTHPVGGTKARLSRYRAHRDKKKYDTDHSIRQKLQEKLDSKDVVSFWAKKCDNMTAQEPVFGEIVDIKTQTHKILEKRYLSQIKEEYGVLPPLHCAIN